MIGIIKTLKIVILFAVVICIFLFLRYKDILS